MPEKQTRLFRIGVRMAPEQQPTEHLVRATSLRVAEDHVTKDMVKGEVATQEDIVRLVQAGVRVQDASAPAAPVPPPAPAPATGRKA